MKRASLEPIHQTTVIEPWLDYNGHLNEAYYVLIFSHATDRLMDLIGMDDAWRRANGMTVYTLETHVRYLREVGMGVAVEVDCRIVGLDAKRAHVFHSMYRSEDRTLLATAEMLLINIDTAATKAAPWAPEVHGRLQELEAAFDADPKPDGMGRSISLNRPRAA